MDIKVQKHVLRLLFEKTIAKSTHDEDIIEFLNRNASYVDVDQTLPSLSSSTPLHLLQTYLNANLTKSQGENLASRVEKNLSKTILDQVNSLILLMGSYLA